MSRQSRLALLVLISLLPFGSRSACAQGVGNAPVVTGVFPSGARLGETSTLKFTGRNLAKVRNLVIQGRGVEVVSFEAESETASTAKIRVASDAEPGFREVRVDGPAGVSNLAILRLDHLKQVVEVEPTQDFANAQTIEPGTAVAGVLKNMEVDHYRIKGTPGQKFTLDLEARRIGSSIAPVVTIFSMDGTALAQGRRSRGVDQDCRVALTIPADGSCIVQVRDNTYGGNDQARYRLRVDPTPFATAVFPLGGSKGQKIELEVAGGNLSRTLRKSITLPETPGELIKPGVIETPDGPVAIPGLIVVGDGPEIVEPADRAEGSSIEVKPGVVVNGRIGKPDEVDRYRLSVKAGEKFRIRIEAAALGSWLDSVIDLRDDEGESLAQNDDSEESVRARMAGSITAIGLPRRAPDSSLEYEAEDEGTLTIEVSDRYGEGGLEYGYRLVVEDDRADLALTLLLGNPTGNADLVNNNGQARTIRITPGLLGLINIKPGATVPINFVISPRGRPGTVEVSVEGLPDGVTAEPVLIRFPGSKSPPNARADPVADFILLKVASDAQPALSEIRIVARARPSPDLVLTRQGEGMIGIDLANVANLPIVQPVDRMQLRVLGETSHRFVGPPAPPRLVNLNAPKELLQGDRIDLKLEFDGIVGEDDGSTIEAKVDRPDLATRVVYPSPSSGADEPKGSEVTVQLLASIGAGRGPSQVTVTYTPPGRPAMTKVVSIEVKVPIEVSTTAEPILLRPGDQATFSVEIKREPGFEGEVEIKLEGLPEGVKPPMNLEVLAKKSTLAIKLEMNAEAKAFEMPVALRVVGMARMPYGNVPVESKIRPMIAARPADK